MKIVLILPRAMQRMEEIYDYYFQFSEVTAARIYNEILDRIELLAHFPFLGYVEQQFSYWGKFFRSLIVKNYKIIYYIEDSENTIYIATVWDCRQNPDKLKYEIFTAD